MTHICVSELTIIGSDNGLSPGRRQAIICNNARLLLIEPLGTNFREISIGIQTFSLKKTHLNMSSVKWRPFCLGLNVLKKFHYDAPRCNFMRNWGLSGVTNTLRGENSIWHFADGAWKCFLWKEKLIFWFDFSRDSIDKKTGFSCRTGKSCWLNPGQSMVHVCFEKDQCVKKKFSSHCGAFVNNVSYHVCMIDGRKSSGHLCTWCSCLW